MTKDTCPTGETKFCAKCDEHKPLDEFSFSSSSKDGRQSSCKVCTSKYMREYWKRNGDVQNSKKRRYRKDNPERLRAQDAANYQRNRRVIRARHKAYRDRNIEADRERSRKYYTENLDYLLAYKKLYYAQNRGREIMRTAEYYRNNSDAARARQRITGKAYYQRNREHYAERSRIRRAQQASVEYDPSLTIEALRDRDGDFCCYCGAHLSFEGDPQAKERANLEHILPVSKGGAHTFSNTAIACRRCNQSKGDRKFIWEWVSPIP